MSTRLRDGSTVKDPRLGRIPYFDERSKQFPVMATIEERKPRSYSWNKKTYLDQGREGACVGFSLAHELSARPKIHEVDADLALDIYREAQRIDEWEGEGYSGTSVLAGAKVLMGRQLYTEYRWAFGEDDLALAVGYKGPAVLGIPWYDGMYDTDDDGFIAPTGELQGYHAILCAAISLRRDAYRLDNSWGEGWGSTGSAWVKREHMRDVLLPNNGEALVPVTRV